MSSKIKVDTIENVAGSGNVSLGSGHNLVVPGNLTVDTSTFKVDASSNKVLVNIDANFSASGCRINPVLIRNSTDISFKLFFT